MRIFCVILFSEQHYNWSNTTYLHMSSQTWSCFWNIYNGKDFTSSSFSVARKVDSSKQGAFLFKSRDYWSNITKKIITKEVVVGWPWLAAEHPPNCVLTAPTLSMASEKIEQEQGSQEIKIETRASLTSYGGRQNRI